MVISYQCFGILPPACGGFKFLASSTNPTTDHSLKTGFNRLEMELYRFGGVVGTYVFELPGVPTP